MTGFWVLQVGLKLAPSSSPKSKWHDTTWLHRLHAFPLQNSVVWYLPGTVHGLSCAINALSWSGRGLICQNLPGSKFTVKTMGRHLPKPVAWSFLACPYTLSQENQVIWNIWAGQGKTKSSVTWGGEATPLQSAHRREQSHLPLTAFPL